MIVATLREDLVQGPREAMYESDSFACIEGYARQNLGNDVFEYFITLTAIHYKDKQIVKQRVIELTMIQANILAGTGKIMSD